jgi:hypothetical protein
MKSLTVTKSELKYLKSQRESHSLLDRQAHRNVSEVALNINPMHATRSAEFKLKDDMALQTLRKV